MTIYRILKVFLLLHSIIVEARFVCFFLRDQ